MKVVSLLCLLTVAIFLGCSSSSNQVVNDEARGFFDRGKKLYAEYKHDEAREMFEKAIELEPDFAEAHGWLGHTLRRLGRDTESPASYGMAIALGLEDKDVYIGYASALSNTSRMTESIAMIDKALKLDPDYYWTHYVYSACLYDMGRIREAIEEVDKSLEDEPDAAASLWLKACLFEELGNTRASVEYYEKAASVVGCAPRTNEMADNREAHLRI